MMDEKKLIEITFLEKIIEKGIFSSSAKKYKNITERYLLANWIRSGYKKGEWILIEENRQELIDYLSTIWPTRHLDIPLLARRNLSPHNESHLKHLPTLRRSIEPINGMINNKTLRSLYGNGPKGSSWLEPTKDTIITHDAITRFKPNMGLFFQKGSEKIDLTKQAMVCRECAIPQRAYLNGAGFTGSPPKAIVTIENLGAYIDMPTNQDYLYIFSPGSDLNPAKLILSQFPNVLWVHFGDIDPEGLNIFASLRNALDRNGRFYIPSYADEYLDLSQKKNVVWSDDDRYPLIQRLKDKNIGMYQEVLTLDMRFSSDLTEFIEQS